jgi:TPR repeat protein
LFNGSGIAKDESAAAALFLKAARKGSPIAQNRLANIFARGRGLPQNSVEAIKWHLIAKAGGDGDVNLDTFVAQQKPEDRAAAQKAAKPWLDMLAASRP